MKIPVIGLEYCILCEIRLELAPHTVQINDADFIDVPPIDDNSDEAIDDAIKNCPKGRIVRE